MEKNKEISFQLKGMELLDVKLSRPEKPLPTKTTFHFNINVEHRINSENKLIVVICSIDVMHEDKITLLGSIKASCIFEVMNMGDFVVSENNIQFPEAILTTFNSVTISTIRGMMFTQFKGTFLHNAFLPIINPQSFVVNK